MGGILSGLLGGGSSPGQDAQMQGLKASRADIQRYRPEAMQARLNALSNATTGYQGSNNALETLWGDPNPPAQQPWYEGKPVGSPETVMGHEMPQGPVQGTDPRYVDNSRVSPATGLLDPANIYGKIF